MSIQIHCKILNRSIMLYMLWNLKTPWGNDYAVYFLAPSVTLGADTYYRFSAS